MKTMICVVVEQWRYGPVRREVSLPLIEPLLDGKKYMLPTDPKPPKTETELRARPPRGPTLRSLVKLAVRCADAEEMGKALKKRFDRQQRYRGIDPGKGRERRAELERILSRN